MKRILRNTIINAISLVIIDQVLAGVTITGGFQTYIMSGFILSILFLVIRPILNIFSLPLNMATFGLFSFFTNAILLYLLTIFVPNISITAFTFNGYSIAGFVIPVMRFNTLYAFVITAGLLSFIVNFFAWLIKK